MTAPRLSKRLLQAMQEALDFRLAGEIENDPDAPNADDYRDAADWIAAKLQRFKP